MRYILIDFETRSACDLRACGAEVYAEHPSTEIICASFAVYDADTGRLGKIYSWEPLLKGQPIPVELTGTSHRADAVFLAHNAGFEQAIWRHVMVPQHGLPDLPPERWDDTQAWALHKGMPGKLEALADALDVDNKDQEGTKLIHRLCKPRKPRKAEKAADPDWERKTFWHEDAESLEKMARYCDQDIRVEAAVAWELGPLPDHERQVWVLDQRINQLGVKIDTPLVRAAKSLMNKYHDRICDQVADLTNDEVSTPGQLAAMSKWVEARMGRAPQDWTKETVEKAVNSRALKANHPDVHRLFELRLAGSKASTAKLDKMLSCTCADGRARHLLQYQGAASTGRWCLTGDHEILTPEGWVALDQWTGGPIACWSECEEVSFQQAQAQAFPYIGDLVHHTGSRIDQLSTPEHRMPGWAEHSGKFQVKEAKDVKARGHAIPFTGTRHTGNMIDQSLLRVLIMVQADGHYTTEGALRFRFKKARKVERCRALLRRANIIHAEQSAGKDGATVITVRQRHQPLAVRMFRHKTFGSWLLDCNPDVVFDELEKWDACRAGPQSIQYSTTNRRNADLIQALAHLSLRSATIISKRQDHQRWNICYAVNIWLEPGNRAVSRVPPETVPFEGTVYCPATSTGFFLVRRKDKVWVTGNSGRLIQPQNLPHGKAGEDQAARADAIMAGDVDLVEMMFGDPAQAVSDCLRGMIVAEDGHDLVFGDFAAIEARVVLALAGQHDKTRLMARGGDVYCDMATKIFGYKVEGKKTHPEERQVGKAAVLGLGFQCGDATFQEKFCPDRDLEFCDAVVQTYRHDWAPKVPEIWSNFEACAIDAAENGTSRTYKGVTWEMEGAWLTARLPSGRRLYYAEPRVRLRPMPWDKTDKRPGLFFRAWKYGAWREVASYGGLLTENVVQAIARDLMADAMLKAQDHGLNVILTVHDEVGCEVQEGTLSTEAFERIMTTNPPQWAKDIGIPLAAEAWVGKRYQK